MTKLNALIINVVFDTINRFERDSTIYRCDLMLDRYPMNYRNSFQYGERNIQLNSIGFSLEEKILNYPPVCLSLSCMIEAILNRWAFCFVQYHSSLSDACFGAHKSDIRLRHWSRKRLHDFGDGVRPSKKWDRPYTLYAPTIVQPVIRRRGVSLSPGERMNERTNEWINLKCWSNEDIRWVTWDAGRQDEPRWIFVKTRKRAPYRYCDSQTESTSTTRRCMMSSEVRNGAGVWSKVWTKWCDADLSVERGMIIWPLGTVRRID